MDHLTICGVIEGLMMRVNESIEIDAAAAIEAAAEGILITTAELDAPGPTIVYVNRAFERITG